MKILSIYIKILLWGLTFFPSIAIGQMIRPMMLNRAPSTTSKGSSTLNFMDLNSSFVTAYHGTFKNPFLNVGVVNGRHTLITTQGLDPNTGNRLSMIPPGDSISIRLGNQGIGAEAEAITYEFEVSAEQSLLLVKFAVVLQDPGHSRAVQPRFVVRILNKNNELVDPCAEYDISASAGIPGFQSFTVRGTPVRWRDWTTISVDLSSYVDDIVRVQFITYDCDHGGHFGYAYYSVECVPSRLNLVDCKPGNDTIWLSAPPFSESYLWTNGDTTEKSMFIIVDGEPFTASCLIRSITGCELTLNAHISPEWFVRDTVLFDTICEGQPYTKNYFNLPPQYRLGTYSRINTFYNPTVCVAMITKVLHLTVLQRYYYINDMICHGEDYEKNGFRILQPSPGVIFDTLRIPRDDKCDSIVCLRLTVSRAAQNLPNIIGNTEPCMNAVEVFTMPDAEHFVVFDWTVPKNVNIIRGKHSSRLTLQFTECDCEATGCTIGGGDTLKLFVANGCGSGNLQLVVNPKPSYYLSFEDSICSGNTYNKNDFNIPRQDVAGFRIFTQNRVTYRGCDSVRELFLHILPTPNVDIYSSTAVICVEDSVQLHVVPRDNPIFDFSSQVKIGDIVCVNGTVETKENFKRSGKIAQGVIFWIDPSGTHAWVAGLRDTVAKWGLQDVFVTDVETQPSWGWRSIDTSGYQNTRAMRLSVADNPSRGFYASYVVDFENGWFVPAATQMRILYANIPYINESFEIAKGIPFSTHLNGMTEAWRYWSSTQATLSNNTAHTIRSSGTVDIAQKQTELRVRPIRYFRLLSR